MATHRARWEGGHMTYIFYTKAEALKRAKESASEARSNYLYFDGDYFERQGSRWYKYGHAKW